MRFFSVFRFFDPEDQELYFFGLSTAESPPAGVHFPVLDQGAVIFGHTFRPPSKSLITYIVLTYIVLKVTRLSI